MISRFWDIVAAFCVVVMATLFAILALSHCASMPRSPIAEPPDRAAARSTVLVVAHAIAVADKACAATSLSMADDHKATALHLAKECAAAYRSARAGLLIAEATLDAYGASEAGRLGCGMRAGLRGMQAFKELLAMHGAMVPAALEDAMQLANVAVQFAPVQCIADTQLDAGAE